MKHIRNFLFLSFVLALITGCGDEQNPSKIPYVLVDEDINLKNLLYQDLEKDGGYIYFNAGYKGLIIYNNGGTFKAFERACTYDPASDCVPLEVDDSGLFIIHTCCGSNFDFNGNPLGGPATFPLLQYSTYINGDYLLIRSE